MRKSSWRTITAAVALTGLAWALGGSASWADQATPATGGREAAAAQTPPATVGEAAVWTPKEARFIYQGFTSRYSCDGLRDRMRDILLQLGARKQDLKVTEVPCSSATGQPDPFPGVHIKMSVLQPAGANPGGNGNSAPVPAHWKTVDLGSQGTGIDQSGQCELLDQVKRSILPLFATRNVEFSSNCVPHQLQVGATRLRAEVLVPDPADTQSPRQP